MRRSPLRSPPRMRGKVWLHQKPGRVPGITPAYAGKSPPAKRKNPAIWDHPRVCGEKLGNLLNLGSNLGSPPRVRGKAAASRCTRITPGITPACAGKSRRGPDVRRRGRDHPRVCGEKYHHESPFKGEAGSPPRVRGKGTIMKRWHAVAGITPACAGKSAHCACVALRRWDHPRVCGEKACMQCTLQGHGGSPPRVRGKEKPLGKGRGKSRITPACAGKS